MKRSTFDASGLAIALRRYMTRGEFETLCDIVRKAGDSAGEAREYAPNNLDAYGDAWKLLQLAEKLEGLRA